ncbi:MAG TPA: arginine deiminase family protein [Vicinamibacterales bacterium]|nr:arginine deiminase family protein [Vicinamibacterales bacterium]
MSTSLSEVGRLVRVVVKRPLDAFIDQATIARQWETLHFAAPPDLDRATREHDRLVGLLESVGAKVHLLPRDAHTTLDSIYVRDASIVSEQGVILCNMGKPQRADEPAAQARAIAAGLLRLSVHGRIEPPGVLEGGDVIWLDRRTLVVGRGYRTNAEGVRQLRALLGDTVDVVEVALPHWRGRHDVMHLMSLISPVDHDMAVVYPALMPVVFREWLLERGMRLIEVPDEEFETMGTNVLALSPGHCLMLAGNPRTRAALEHAGAEVIEYEGTEISVKGAGGPTCLTRPLERLV